MNLDKQNYLIFAAQNYTNLHCTSIDDFHRDAKVFTTARTLLRVYHKTRRIKIRLLLNHIITCTNVFSPRATVALFYFLCEPELHSYLKAVFDFLQIEPELPTAIIEPDPRITTLLEKL